MVGLLALFLAIGDPAWMDVPFTRQEENACAAASAWMVMEYWNQSPQPPEEIHRTLYSQQAAGVFATDLVQYLAGQGFQTFPFSGQWGDIAENVRKGRPLIVGLRGNSAETPLHYVVVAGIQEQPEVVLINDPARGKLLSMERTEFEKRWAATDQWTLLALPRDGDLPSSAKSVPTASRIDLEDASNAFRNGDYQLAKRLARRAPRDPLVDDFLGTIFFLEDNLEAALKFWNRIDKPRIRQVPTELETTIARGNILRVDDYLLARKRLDASRTFSRYVLGLEPTEEDDFDVSLRAVERGGLQPVGWLRGLPYKSVAPDFINLGGRAINLDSLVRWDTSRRRAFLAVSGPAGEGLRYRIAGDFRNELWKGVPVRKKELSVTLERVANAHWSWSSGIVAGTALKYDGAMTYDWLRVPERKLTVSSGIRGVVGQSSGRFARLETDTRISWRDAKFRVRNGHVVGQAPLGELFSVGLDRDHDLWMRAHNDRLIGRRYLLLNAEVEKKIFDSAFVGLKLAPFVDVARVGGSFVDTGVDVRVSLASLLTFSLSIGRDLKEGRTVLFTNVTR